MGRSAAQRTGKQYTRDVPIPLFLSIQIPLQIPTFMMMPIPIPEINKFYFKYLKLVLDELMMHNDNIMKYSYSNYSKTHKSTGKPDDCEELC